MSHLQEYNGLTGFRFQPERRPMLVKVNPSRFGAAQIKFTVVMIQFPINLN